MNSPFVYSSCIIYNTTCCQVRNQFLINKFIQRKTISGLIIILIIINVSYYAVSHLKLHITCTTFLFGLYIPILKVQTRYTSFRYYIGSQHKSSYCNNGCRYHIRTHQTLKTHSGGEHSNNL